jgi:hypothetical protein
VAPAPLAADLVETDKVCDEITSVEQTLTCTQKP